jgi:glyoxylase-like metal-dependent hydrolase (beta-lactamase superfamily II)/acetyl esterase/lipase
MRTAVVLALQLGMAAAAAGQQQQPPLRQLGYERTWIEATPPQHIVGPIYYVGTRGLAAYVISTPAGLILLDGGLPQSAADLAESIRKAGFKPEDIGLILVAQARIDNAGTAAYFKKLSGGGARVAVMAGDADLLASGGRSDPWYGTQSEFYFPPVTPDQILHDGDTVSLGDVRLVARLGAGQTRGATTFITTVKGADRQYGVVFPCCTEVIGTRRILANATFPGSPDDYQRRLAMLDSLRPDIWLATRPDAFEFESKRERVATVGVVAWVDPDGYRRWLLIQSGKLADRPVGDMRFAGGRVAAPEPFYDPPDSVPAQPGRLLRQELLQNRELPAGTRAWRILYTTTLNDSTVAVASATVLAPIAPSTGARPVISWAHGSIGIVPKCAPSMRKNPIDDVPGLDQIVSRGWVLVAPDYTGLGTVAPNPYLIGQGEARSSLDAVRAAHQMKELSLDPRTVVWGHSQGGHAALWQGIIAPTYAPDANVIGVFADSPPTDMGALLTIHRGDPVEATVGSFVATAYSQVYSDVEFDKLVRPSAQDAARQMAGLCFDGDGMRVAEPLLEKLVGSQLLANPDSDGLGNRLRENDPNGPIAVPMLVVQGMADEMVSPEITGRFVQQQCLAGMSIEYITFAGLDHGTMDSPGSRVGPEVVRWTQDRLENRAQKVGCTRREIGK